VTIEWDPFVIKSPDGNFSGICIDILEALSETLGFDYNVTHGSDKTWDGMVSDVVERKMDLGVQTFSWTEERSKIVDYLPPFQAWAYGKGLPWTP
jgi:ABC-type amino acid transport substrate-binding protein